VGKAELNTLRRQVQKVERLERELQEAREALWLAVVAAHASGESVAGIARQLGVSRARVYQLIEKANGSQH
jgi:hypothetical protein